MHTRKKTFINIIQCYKYSSTLQAIIVKMLLKFYDDIVHEKFKIWRESGDNEEERNPDNQLPSAINY